MMPLTQKATPMPQATTLLIAILLTAGCAPSVDDESNVAATTNDQETVNAAVVNSPEQASEEGPDAKVTGTDYQAVADIPCGASDTLDASCSAGVKRSPDMDGTSFVEVTRPDGSKRVLFFQGKRATGADSSQADGSADYRFLWRRENDGTVIEYGPERYRVPDALVVGG